MEELALDSVAEVLSLLVCLRIQSLDPRLSPGLSLGGLRWDIVRPVDARGGDEVDHVRRGDLVRKDVHLVRRVFPDHLIRLHCLHLLTLPISLIT